MAVDPAFGAFKSETNYPKQTKKKPNVKHSVVNRLERRKREI